MSTLVGGIDNGGGGGGAPSGPAGGDLGGTYPNPTVVSVADVTTGVLAPANGGAAVVSTVGQGYLAPPNVNSFMGLSAATAVLVGSANQVRAVSFVLPYKISIGHITWFVQAGAGDTVSFGIYSADGTTKLVDSGATVSVGAAASQTVSISTATITPAPYLFAWTQTGTPTTTFGIINATTNMNTIFNASATKKMGTCANSATAGALPSSTGAITAFSMQTPMVIFEP